MTTHLRCIMWAIAGVILGIAATAYGQDVPAPVAAPDPYTPMVLELVRAGGLPAVLGALGLVYGRGGIPLVVQFSLSPALEATVTRLEALAGRVLAVLERLADRQADREDTGVRRRP